MYDSIWVNSFNITYVCGTICDPNLIKNSIVLDTEVHDYFFFPSGF